MTSLKKRSINIQQKIPSNNFCTKKYKLLKILSINRPNCSQFSLFLYVPKFWNDVLNKKNNNIQSYSVSLKNLNQNYFALKRKPSTSKSVRTIFKIEKLQRSCSVKLKKEYGLHNKTLSFLQVPFSNFSPCPLFYNFYLLVSFCILLMFLEDFCLFLEDLFLKENCFCHSIFYFYF